MQEQLSTHGTRVRTEKKRGRGRRERGAALQLHRSLHRPSLIAARLCFVPEQMVAGSRRACTRGPSARERDHRSSLIVSRRDTVIAAH